MGAGGRPSRSLPPSHTFPAAETHPHPTPPLRLNLAITVYTPLSVPVTGLLGDSYKPPAQRFGIAAATTTSTTNVVASATVTSNPPDAYSP